MFFYQKMIFRKSMRLPSWDYSQEGKYFLTLCINQREHLFGKIENNRMVLNEYGWIVEKKWKELNKYFPEISLDAFVVMPNHFHGVIFIRNKQKFPVEVIHELPLKNIKPRNSAAIRELQLRGGGEQGKKSQSTRRKMLIPKIIGRFKMQTAKTINIIRKTPSQSIWQRSYHDHILRSDNDLNRIREYIINNPLNWNRDRNNLGYL